MSARRNASTQQAHERLYTADASRDAEARVTQDLAQLSTAIDGALGAGYVALVLLGSYARGDGSVVERDDELQAYSPYELLVITRKHSPQQSLRISQLADRWSEELGVAVHLHERTQSQLQHATPALTWLDACTGGAQVLAGDPTALRLLRHLHGAALSAECWGTLLCDAALRLAAINVDESERAQRGPQHIHHAVLACGDALLLSMSRYAPRGSARSQEIERLEPALEVDGLAEAYADARRFQARPDTWRAAVPFATFHATRIELLKRVHLALEARRTGAPRDPFGYALFARRLWAGTGFLPFAALCATLRAAREGERHAHAHRGDARERLARCAVLLAYAFDRPEAQRLAARLLGCAEHDERTPSELELREHMQKLTAEARIMRDDPLAGARYGRP